MSIFEWKKPVWPVNADFNADFNALPEVRDGLNPDICQHGWHRNTCGKCKPIKKKKHVQKVR